MTLSRFSDDLETLAFSLEAEPSPSDRRRAEWIVEQVCDTYLDAEADARLGLQHVLLRHPILRPLFCDEIARAAGDLERDAAPRHLRRALTAAVLADRVPDERSWRIRLSGLICAPSLPPRVVDALWLEACAAALSEATQHAMWAEDQRRRTRSAHS